MLIIQLVSGKTASHVKLWAPFSNSIECMNIRCSPLRTCAVHRACLWLRNHLMANYTAKVVLPWDTCQNPYPNCEWSPWLTSTGFKWNASAIFPYSSFTFVNPSILPVGLPWASCVWNTSFGRRLAGGGGSPAPLMADFAACPLTSSFSTKFELSFVDFFFFLIPKGILA